MGRKMSGAVRRRFAWHFGNEALRDLGRLEREKRRRRNGGATTTEHGATIVDDPSPTSSESPDAQGGR